MQVKKGILIVVYQKINDNSDETRYLIVKNNVSWGLLNGIIQKDETELGAAKRILKEKLGIITDKVIKTDVVHAVTGNNSTIQTVFIINLKELNPSVSILHKWITKVEARDFLRMPTEYDTFEKVVEFIETDAKTLPL